ncbi:MAG TPA: metallophosphoesterase [Smithella sp.]|jgi:predicted MPP superfamily phosphohydrolase|nr:metallophosphoesterase [Smithella sp.]HOE32912.1 metallophosphoesterase [Smithella sp.]HOG10118.1 metallophosphoesterase [Smithella sp.]HOO35703.1 metallophosphoesterase [Smithella sp.]HOS14112.1 metallophosphoesterase [Smithella sp.]
MILFLLIFLSLYGGINFYAFLKAKTLFHFSGKIEIIIIISMIFLILAPIIIKLAEKIHWETLARSIAYCGYLWMAFVFLFFVIHVSFDLIRPLLKIIFQTPGGDSLKNILFFTALFLSLSFVVYGFFDAKNIQVKKLEIHTEKLPPGHETLRIVQISDVHIGLIVRGKRLQNILEKVREAKPDILVSTGDLLDGELDNIASEAKRMMEIKPKFGKYAIMGNHEYYAGIEKSLAFTKSAGFEILRDESKKIAGIHMIGLDDPTGRGYGVSEKNPSLSNLFPVKKSKEFILLLKHQPTIREDKNFDLQLSGHTHGGQIFPFMFLTRIFFPKNSGYHQLSDNKSVYISKGAGTWGPPVRFLAPPEITIIDVIKK